MFLLVIVLLLLGVFVYNNFDCISACLITCYILDD
nr:MAG TPA: Clathrin heavy chain 1 associated protein [Crassvirales sp.]